MNIVRLYNCPYFINGECSLRSHDDPLIDFWNSKYIAEAIIPHCPKGRAYCNVDVDTDKWSKGTLELIHILVKDWRRKGSSNAGEIIEIIEQILRRRDDMKDLSTESLCVSRKCFEEKQAEARQEAWDLARRIVTCGPDCYTGSDFDSVFGSCNSLSIFEMPVDEALAKDKKHQEEKKALHVGDEVEFGFKAISNNKYRGYIINFISPNTVRVLTKEVGTVRIEPEDCKKTGKHSEEIERAMASFEEGE